MPVFRDPIQSLTVEIPAGWAYDSFRSSLTSFYFSHWDKPDSLLAVRIRRAPSIEAETAEQWAEQIRQEIGGSTPLVEIPCKNSRAVAATFTSVTGSVQRVVFMRSRPVEILIEQRGGDSSAADPWEPLYRAVQTADSEANKKIEGNCSPEEFNRCIQEANKSFEEEDIPSVIDALKKAVQTGVLSWLNNLASAGGGLELHAPIRLSQALINLGRFTENPGLLRDAEFILLRVRRTVEESRDKAEPSQELVAEINETLTDIVTEQLGASAPDGETPSPILAMRERAFRSVQDAGAALQSQDWEKAADLSGAAVEDLLTLISFLRRSGAALMSDEIAAQLAAEGITDAEQQRQVIQHARESVLFPPLNAALQIQHCCAIRRQDVESAMDAVMVLLPLAQFLSEADPENSGIRMNLALASMAGSTIAALSGNSADMDDAMRLLDDASRALLGIGALSHADKSWILHYVPVLEMIRNAVGRGIEAAETERLELFQTRFAKISEMFQAAIARNQKES
jgi:hypothetical protein